MACGSFRGVACVLRNWFILYERPGTYTVGFCLKMSLYPNLLLEQFLNTTMEIVLCYIMLMRLSENVLIIILLH
jgi:hypothetical protein